MTELTSSQDEKEADVYERVSREHDLKSAANENQKKEGKKNTSGAHRNEGCNGTNARQKTSVHRKHDLTHDVRHLYQICKGRAQTYQLVDHRIRPLNTTTRSQSAKRRRQRKRQEDGTVENRCDSCVRRSRGQPQ